MWQTGRSKQSSIRRWSSLTALALAVAVVAALARPAPASAHCDSTSGPVVGAAREALDSRDVRPVLAYVKPDAEAELSAAFRQSLEVRQAGGSAQDLADRYFFEAAVRLHRQGEGAAYTGLKENVEVGPALTAAERALETGDVDTVSAVIGGAVRAELHERYQAVLAARERATHEGTVTAAREQAEAELAFETYVDKVYQSALGQASHDRVVAAAPEEH